MIGDGTIDLWNHESSFQGRTTTPSLYSFDTLAESLENSSFNETNDDDQDIVILPSNRSSFVSNGTIGSFFQVSLEESSKAWYDLNQDINDLDDDQDVISFDESQKRLNCLCIILALPCIILTSVLVGISYRAFQPPQILISNNYVQQYEAKVPHVMILSSDGDMIPYTWKSNPKTRGNFPKLPKSKVYGMISYQDNLYAFSLSKFNGMTMIRPNGTNRLIQSPKQELFQKHGKVTLVNKFPWALGMKTEVKEQQWHINIPEYLTETYLYSFRKQNKNWNSGPRIPNNFDMINGCVVTINRTFVIVIGKETNLLYSGEGYVYGYDFHSSMWISMERIPLPCLCTYLENGKFIGYNFHISCAIQHLKQSSKIIAMTTINRDLLSDLYEEMSLWEFDLKSNIWNNVLVQGLHHKGELVVLQGVIHYFLHPNHDKNTLGFFFNETTIQFERLREPGVYVNGSSYPLIIPAISYLTV